MSFYIPCQGFFTADLSSTTKLDAKKLRAHTPMVRNEVKSEFL